MNSGRAAVVFHLPVRLMTRRSVKEFKRSYQGEWPSYRWYALAWCQANIDYALMGDDTVYDVVRSGNSFADLASARSEAEEWLRVANEEIRPVEWDAMPGVARSFASQAIRRGW